MRTESTARIGRVERIHAPSWNADLPGVTASPAFETVLDQKLDEVGAWATLSHRNASSSARMPDPSLRASLWSGTMVNPFGARAFAGQSWAAASTDAPPAAPPDPVVAEPGLRQPQESRRVRPHVMLAIVNMQQRMALAEFVEVGIASDARQVSQDDLRAAYRTLAHAYHPDRHQAASEAARARYAARFARIAAAYGVLTAAPMANA